MSAPAGIRTAPPAPPRPAPGDPRPYHFPAFERLTLPNGLGLVIAPVAKLPIVTVLALVDAGAVTDPLGMDGSAALVAESLSEGTAGSSGVELAERLEQLGADFDATAGWESTLGRLTVTADRLPRAMELLAEILRTPTFPEREVERLKAERLAEILQTQAEPRGLADEMFARFIYQPTSRYALPDAGTKEGVSAIGRDDAAAFYAARYRPGSTTLIVVGDVSVDGATRLVSQAFGDWSGEPVLRLATSDLPRHVERRVHVVAKEDAPQSELRIGHVGLPRSHPDFFPVVVMNSILGGVFSSRINLNLREKNAYTYGAFSAFEWRRGAGPFEVSTAVRTDVTDAAAREVLHEIDRIREREVTPEELSLVLSYLDGVFPIRYETTSAIATALANLVQYDLPADYYDRYRDEIRRVSAAEVLRAAREHLHPERMQLVTVGDPQAVREPLAALGFGELTVYDAEGKAIG